MWIGFHDDPVLRYGPDRQAEIDDVRAANATIVRTLVEWRSVAPKRPPARPMRSTPATASPTWTSSSATPSSAGWKC